jgi:hypothetical protein
MMLFNAPGNNFQQMAILLQQMFDHYHWENPPNCQNFNFPTRDNIPTLENFLNLFGLNIQRICQLMQDYDSEQNYFFQRLVNI